MSAFTNLLNLFKWNPTTDADEEFDIEKALNENWDKLDTLMSGHVNNTSIPHAKVSQTKDGMMSKEDKIKLDNIESGAQKNLIETHSILRTTTTIAENTDYTIPANYKVGLSVLDIYYMGEKLVKDEHYIEVGEIGAISNIIQFKDWGQSVPKDRIIEFVVKGEYSSES